MMKNDYKAIERRKCVWWGRLILLPYPVYVREECISGMKFRSWYKVVGGRRITVKEHVVLNAQDKRGKHITVDIALLMFLFDLYEHKLRVCRVLAKVFLFFMGLKVGGK